MLTKTVINQWTNYLNDNILYKNNWRTSISLWLYCLYDITSTYFGGEYEDSSLVKYGYSRDCKRGHEQVNIGLLTNVQGCPVAIETFPGNTQDQVTVKGQVKQLVNEFNVKDVVFVGDRGMLLQNVLKRLIKGF